MALYKYLTISLMVCGSVVGQKVVYCPLTFPNGSQACLSSSTNYPSTSVTLEGKASCAGACFHSNCQAFSFNETYLQCTLYQATTKPTFQPGSNCNIYQESSKQLAGDTTLIPAPNCSFPFTFQGKIYYTCMNTVYDPVRECNKFACFKRNRTWATCLPKTEGFVAQTSFVNVTYRPNDTTLRPYPPLQRTVTVPSIYGWMIIQTRINSDPSYVTFNRTWDEFSKGFGDTTSTNFYLGNEPLSQLTSARPYSLRVELLASGAWYSAEYLSVRVDASSPGYALRVTGYSGDAGDSLSSANGVGFTTYDAPGVQCAVTMAGWWYNPCNTSMSNLNNPFTGPNAISWASLTTPQASGTNGANIQSTRMMIKATGG